MLSSNNTEITTDAIKDKTTNSLEKVKPPLNLTPYNKVQEFEYSIDLLQKATLCLCEVVAKLCGELPSGAEAFCTATVDVKAAENLSKVLTDRTLEINRIIAVMSECTAHVNEHFFNANKPASLIKGEGNDTQN